MESKIALEVLFERFKVLRAVNEEVKWMDSYFARGPTTLPMEFVVDENKSAGAAKMAGASYG
jgi:cytochrome P450